MGRLACSTPHEYDLPELSVLLHYVMGWLPDSTRDGWIRRHTCRWFKKAWAGLLHHVYADGRPWAAFSRPARAGAFKGIGDL